MLLITLVAFSSLLKQKCKFDDKQIKSMGKTQRMHRKDVKTT
jgi:hypothetical protein